jgi:uncharacterized protein (DUF302 family)
MSVKTETIGISIYLNMTYESALDLVTAELKKEGFGILTEIDVKATLKQKLDVDFRPYKILGACNPPLAHRALQAVAEVGLLLPCNVTVSQEEDDRILVSILNPNLMAQLIADPNLAKVAQDAEERLRRVATALDAA